MAENSQSLESLFFREYDEKDEAKCVEMTANAWPELMGKGLSLATIEWYAGSATWREIACISDSVVGLLFGRIDCELNSFGRLRILFAHISVYLKVLFGLYGKIPHRLMFLEKSLSDDRNVRVHSPKIDGEVAFFIVDASCRGRGIGRQLMNRFINHARKREAKRISVFTTDPGSSWEFYERYGFKKYSSFREEFSSFSRKENVTGMIYVLDL